MKELGKVVRVEDGKGIIEIAPRGGCDHCGINNFCKSTATGKRELELSLKERKYEPGDLVEIETPARSLITAAFLVFILPIIISVIAYSIVFYMTGKSSLALVSFFGFFVISEFLIAWIDRSFGRGSFFESRIIGKLGQKHE